MSKPGQKLEQKPDQKLTRKRCIQSRQDFLRIQSDGRKVRSKEFLLAFFPSKTLESAGATGATGATGAAGATSPDSRIGVTITKKVDRRAVKRNLLRRRIREIFRRERGKFKSPTDIVVVALNGATELNFAEIQEQIIQLIRKARLFKD